MAKRRRAATTTKIVRVGGYPRAPAPIVRVAVPRALPARRHRRRRSGGSVGGGFVSSDVVQAVIGGALYGFAVKSGLVAKLPAIPIIGRTGTAALLLDYFARHGGGHWARSASRSAAAIAGYQLGAEGAIQGDASTPGSMAGDEADGYDPLNPLE